MLGSFLGICLDLYSPGVGKPAIPNTPLPLPRSELMGPGLYLKALFSSIVCLRQGVDGEEEEAESPGLVDVG